MIKSSKRYRECIKLVDKNKAYILEEAISILREAPRAKFDETVELSFKLGIDPKKSDQMVRGTVSLPHGTGKSLRVAVFCKSEQAGLAEEAGADFVGSDELIRKVQSGWLEFDVAIATPDMMRELSKVGRILGPRGLMPSPKSGTVSQDVAKVVGEVKKGKIEFKSDKQAGVHVGIGKISFEENALYENAHSLINAVISHKPAQLKGRYIKSMAVSTTMGPGIKLDLASLKKS